MIFHLSPLSYLRKFALPCIIGAGKWDYAAEVSENDPTLFPLMSNSLQEWNSPSLRSFRARASKMRANSKPLGRSPKAALSVLILIVTMIYPFKIAPKPGAGLIREFLHMQGARLCETVCVVV